jgi:aryl-alcohol dehydrogenase-like predicted oxidoreductase
MSEMALEFILGNQTVSTNILGLRKPSDIESNIAASDVGMLDADLQNQLRLHPRDRKPTKWSQ